MDFGMLKKDGIALVKHLITNSKGKKIWDGGHVEWRDPYDSIGSAVAAEGTDEQKARIA
jgi:hypothetical protein